MLTLLKKRKARAAAKAAIEERAALVSIPELESGSLSDGKENDTPPPRSMLDGKPWDEVQHALKMDLEYARTLAGSEEKVPFKQELIKKYTSTVKHLLDTREHFEGLDVVWWYFQWQIDCGALTDIHDTFKHCVLNGLDSPKGWSSNGHTAYLDIIRKYSDAAYKADTPFNTQYLMEAVQDIINGKLATNAPLKVKLFRLAGDVQLDAGKSEDALALFEMVMAIDPKKGGRITKIKELKEALGHE
ncbi:phage terminase small subunit [Aliivibrio fischeri]|uniref:phage terminase small subunit n=1 Tax=Aliivibrio fischeri TaxID=668 RepID=UPI00080DD591|nr:phage terminase small subunit [Aliivibrio fischeri]OCH43716.1 hypothetical protein A6E02_11525 [Aliivibrio fischeri]